MKLNRWDDEAMKARHQAMLSREIADEGGMITVDPSEFPKKGKEAVGVVRQYCCALGKVDNCQSGVFVGYTSRKDYGLLTSRLYMPEIWFSEEQEERRDFNFVPEELVFQTKPQIASDLIEKVGKTNPFPAMWIGCDAAFGSDWDFLESLPQDKNIFANIKSNSRVFLAKPKVGVPSYGGRGPVKDLRLPLNQFRKIMGTLARQGVLVRIDPKVTMHKEALEKAKAAILQFLKLRRSITIAEAKDVLKVLRKYACAVLEYLDRVQVTRRSQVAHVLK